MRCIVTGGAGFLGSHLCEALLARGHQVCAVDDMFRGKKANVEDCKLMPDFHLVMGDCSKPEILEKAEEKLRGVDVIFHLAAINGTKYFHERPDLVAKVNINTTDAVIEFATGMGCRLVFTSSPEAFGETDEMPLGTGAASYFTSAHEHFRHSYGASKYLNEIQVLHAVAEKGLDARIVRPFNAYGPRLPGNEHGQVVSIFLDQCASESPITIHGDGTQTRSFTWYAEIVEGIIAAGELDQGLDGSDLAGVSFNLGSTEEVTVSDVANLCLEASGSEAGVEMVDGHPGDSRRRLPDVSSAEDALGWTSTMPISEGIALCWAWMSSE